MGRGGADAGETGRRGARARVRPAGGGTDELRCGRGETPGAPPPGGESAGRRQREAPGGELAGRWQREAVAGAARPFGLACAALPVLDLGARYSVVEQIAAGAQAGAWPAVPGTAWLGIGYFAAVAAAAAAVLARRARRGRWRLFAACAALHAGYALATGLRPAVLVSLGLFAWSFVALRSADVLAGAEELA